MNESPRSQNLTVQLGEIVATIPPHSATLAPLTTILDGFKELNNAMRLLPLSEEDRVSIIVTNRAAMLFALTRLAVVAPALVADADAAERAKDEHYAACERLRLSVDQEIARLQSGKPQTPEGGVS